jgi:AraC-like DNA-binding protein
MVYDEDLHEIGEHSFSLKNDIILPDVVLREIVHRYFVITNEETLPPGSTWYILPDNSAHLIFYLFEHGNTIVPKWMVIGPRSKHTIINRQNRVFTFICTFKPGGLKPLVDIPINELKDLPIDSSDVLRNHQSQVFDQLTFHALRYDIVGFIRCLETYLKRSITSATHPAIQGFYERAMGQPDRSLIKIAAKDMGYSDRQLRNIIQSNIGHSPKMVQQIERFTESLRLRKFMENWASIACSSGYYDQSHMISDYQKLVGSSPERLLF